MKASRIFVSAAPVFLLLVGLCLVVWLRFSPLVQPDKVGRYRRPLVDRPNLEAHIGFQEERVRKTRGALDEAALAELYLRQARLSGNPVYLTKAEAAATASRAALTENNDSALLALGQVAEARHDFLKALTNAGEVLARRPKDPGALALLVTSNLGQGELEAAGRYADRFVETRPGIVPYTLRALVLTAQGREEEAIFDYKRGFAVEDLGESQESAWSRALFARFLMQRGKLADARELLAESLRILPQYHLALAISGEVEMSSRDYAAAAKLFLEAFSSSKQVSYLRGFALAKELQGETKLAEEIRKEAETLMRRELSEGSEEHRVELARLLLDRNDRAGLEEARRLASEEAKKRNDAETLFVLASSLAGLGEWDKAYEAIREVLRTGARDPEYFFKAGEIEEARKNPRRASLYYDLAQKANPELKPAKARS